MKRLNSVMRRWPAGTGLVLAAALVCAAAVGGARAADPKTGQAAQPARKTAKKPAAKPAKKQLAGADLYAINCNRCHPERYATEWTAAQWKTLMMHMRVRANLPAKQARIILKYLQEDSGN